MLTSVGTPRRSQRNAELFCAWRTRCLSPGFRTCTVDMGDTRIVANTYLSAVSINNFLNNVIRSEENNVSVSPCLKARIWYKTRDSKPEKNSTRGNWLGTFQPPTYKGCRIAADWLKAPTNQKGIADLSRHWFCILQVLFVVSHITVIFFLKQSA